MTNHAGKIAQQLRQARQAGYLDDITDEQLDAMPLSEVLDLVSHEDPMVDELDPAKLAARWPQ